MTLYLVYLTQPMWRLRQVNRISSRLDQIKRELAVSHRKVIARVPCLPVECFVAYCNCIGRDAYYLKMHLKR